MGHGGNYLRQARKHTRRAPILDSQCTKLRPTECRDPATKRLPGTAAKRLPGRARTGCCSAATLQLGASAGAASHPVRRGDAFSAAATAAAAQAVGGPLLGALRTPYAVRAGAGRAGAGRELEVRGESAASHAKVALDSSERSPTIASRALRRAYDSLGQRVSSVDAA